MSAGTRSGVRHEGSRVGSVPSRRGDVLVSETQRARLLSSTVQIVAEHGYSEMSVARIAAVAGVSRRTFYDLFQDREDCFLAAFEDAVARALESIGSGWREGRTWPAQVRGGLHALLLFLDREPAMGSLLVIDALKAGPQLQRRRGELLWQLSTALHETGLRARRGTELPGLTGEGVVGAVLGVIHTRLSAEGQGSMVDLLGPLMGVIVLPYLGSTAAKRELQRPLPVVRLEPDGPLAHVAASFDPLAGLPMRITQRTLLVLATIDELPGASNRQVADRAGVSDQGQISKLLARLERLGLIDNRCERQPSGEPNRWHLTPRGEQIANAGLAPDERSHAETNGSVGNQRTMGRGAAWS